LEEKNKMVLTEQQIAAIEMVFENRFSIITGKPGTGKTTVLKHILDKAAEQNFLTYCAAPTGKAAEPMQETTKFPASTIHSMLQCTFDGEKFSFVHNSHNHLHASLIIVDETSMITSALCADLFSAISRDTHVVFVGDRYQLPSVGAGAVLRDFIESGLVPYIELDIIHRNAGTIIRACASIHAGNRYEPDSAIDLDSESPKNCLHIEALTPDQTAAAIVTQVCERLPQRGFDPTNDIQVISPVNNKGSMSCEALNIELRKRLNAEGENADWVQDTGSKFWPGDKVINTKNGTFKADEDELEDEFYVSNGDIGIVREIIVKGKDKNLVIDFSAPNRSVLISISNNDLLHAWAITCHRFQGSQSPVIVIPVHSYFSYYIGRSWIYTAISRAKTLCITVGNFEAIKKMIDNNKDHRRVTGLQERMLDYQMMKEGI